MNKLQDLAIRTTALLTAALAVGGAAYADCPNGLNTVDHCYQVCTMNLGHVWECDLNRNGDTATNAQAQIVYGHPDSSEDYQAWGREGYPSAGLNGREFCCEITEDDIDRVVLLGTDLANIPLAFWFDDGGTEYNLSNHGGVVKVTGRIDARSGADVIRGSRETGADYKDELHAGDGVDLCWGQEGDDEILGNNGNDQWLDGGPGEDIVDGGVGDDIVRGGDDDDVVLGGPGDDTVCGNAGTGDVAMGGYDDDVVWDTSATDEVKGEGGSDECGDSDVPPIYATCDAYISAEPGECIDAATGP